MSHSLHSRRVQPRGSRHRLALVLVVLVAMIGFAAPHRAAAQPSTLIDVVAAESFYGDIIQQLGGVHVRTTSIISDPAADPHEYEPTVPDARSLVDARLVVKNGLGYDAFMDKLLGASPNSSRIVLDVGRILGKSEGDNPHVWYNVDWMSTIAGNVTAALTQLDPADAAYFDQRLQAFQASFGSIRSLMAQIIACCSGAHLTQTEPVFGYMGEALGLNIDNGEFQHAIEEGIDPSPQAVAAIRNSISRRQVKALLYNIQTTAPITEEVRALAERSGIPVVEVTETPPPGKSYQQWIADELQSLLRALTGSA